MPLNETDKSWIREAIRDAHKPRGKLAQFIKDWGATGAVVAVILFFLLQWNAHTEFRVHTNDKLDNIERGLLHTNDRLDNIERRLLHTETQSALQWAEQEAKAGNVEDARQHIDQATRLIEKLAAARAPAPALFFQSTASALEQLRSAGLNAQDTHQASLKLADYRSALNPVPALPERTDTLPQSPAESPLGRAVYPNAASINFSNGTKPATVSGYGATVDCRAMKTGQEIFIPGDRSLTQNPVTIKGLTFIGATQTLDHIVWEDVTFVGTNIKYLGGPVRLRNVRFVNCTFDFPANDAGQQFAKYAALEPKQELTLDSSPMKG